MGTITGLQPGKSGTFTLTPLDEYGNVTVQPAGVIPVWTVPEVSDVVEATVVPADDGMSAVITAKTTVIPGTAISLAVESILPDKTVPKVAVTIPVLTLPVDHYEVTQTA